MGDVEAELMEAFLEDCDSEVFSPPDPSSANVIERMKRHQSKNALIGPCK